MRHAHGGVGGVHVLAALAAGAVRVDAQVVELQVDVNGLVDLRRNIDRRERGVPSLGLVEGRDAHQPMHAAFAGQHAKGIFAHDGEGGGLDAGPFAVLVVVHLGFESLTLGPAQIHAHQHLGPVLALGAARAGMHGHDRIQRVGLSVQHGPGFEFFGKSPQLLDALLQIQKNIFALARQLEVGFNVAGAADQFLVVTHQCFEALFVAHQWLGGVWIGPQRRIGELGFYFREFPAQPRRVKDTPGGRAPDCGPERKRIRDRSATCFLLV